MERFSRHSLNSAVLALAPSHVAQANAPSTFDQLMNVPAGPLPVWDGESERTIFGDARVNHAFRSWHDTAHRAGLHLFTLEGERATVADQKRALGLRYPSAPSWVYKLLDAEVSGQAEYFAEHGRFPVDQLQFTMEALGL